MASTKPRPSVQQRAIHEWNGSSSKRSIRGYPQMERPPKKVAVDVDCINNYEHIALALAAAVPGGAADSVRERSRSASLPKRNPSHRARLVMCPVSLRPYGHATALRYHGTGIATKRSSSRMPPPTAEFQLMAVSWERSVALSSRVEQPYTPSRRCPMPDASSPVTLRRPSTTPDLFDALMQLCFDFLAERLDLDILLRVLRRPSVPRLSETTTLLDFFDVPLAPPDMQHHLRCAALRRLAGGEIQSVEASFMERWNVRSRGASSTRTRTTDIL
ncbi:unnamed protein product [Haemonchus placei]|uniref:Uncharacterized protein n=1 Tax=Haemonchus placei TaxID=6290 RepID=A0A0N4WQ90_HAEPC|nr:unnamed protein product [Haemonchus placei]